LGEEKSWKKMKRFNKYTPDEREKKVRLFFRNLQGIYELIINNNFPELADTIPFFDGATTLLIELDLKEQYFRNSFEFPTITIYGLKNDKEQDLNIQIFRKSKNKMPPRPNTELNKNGLEFNGKQYKIVYWKWAILDFIFEDFSMLKFIYKMLLEKLIEYYKIQDFEFYRRLFEEIDKKFRNFEIETC